MAMSLLVFIQSRAGWCADWLSVTLQKHGEADHSWGEERVPTALELDSGACVQCARGAVLATLA